jgi:plasmid maintenance system antidote protein VapI
MTENAIAKEIVDSAFRIHTSLANLPGRARRELVKPVLSLPPAPGCVARVHQKNACYPGGGFGNGAEAQEGVGAVSKKHMGSSLDEFLREVGFFEEAQAQAVKEVVAWQLAEAMKKQKISKNKLAKLLKTSRSQVDRILDPKNDITLGSLQRAAPMVGRRITIDLI